MTTDERATGGTDWELAEAERLMLNAQTPEERALAMRRHSEAIRNMIQISLIPSFQKALGAILDTKLAPITDWLERSDGARVSRNTELQMQIDVRFDAFGAALDEIKTAVGERLDRKRERLDTHERRLNDHDKEIARLKAHLGLDGDGGG